jgi:NAD(P)-dependent dehydrogenase (short-subunit alcohol dehydrogenase family)/acyl dehydratase/acyl carrier protein
VSRREQPSFDDFDDFDDFEVGDVVSFIRTFDRAAFDSFADLSTDRNPLHSDDAYAAGTPFGRPIVPVFLTGAPFSAIAGMGLPGRRSLILDARLRPLAPTPFDVELTYSGRVLERHEANRVLRVRAIAFHGRTVVLEGDLVVQVRDDAASTDHQRLTVERRDEQRVALVLGATGAIGSATCRLLSARGWELILHHRPDGRSRAAQLAATLPGPSHLIGLDLAYPAGWDALAGLPAATAVVHAASPLVPADTPTHLAVGHDALATVIDAVLPDMLRRQHGRILNVGSSALQHPPEGWEAYVAGKSASAALIESLHTSHSRFGIECTTVAPGRVRSAFSADLPGSDIDSLLPEEVAESIVRELDAPTSGGYILLEPGRRVRGHYRFVADGLADTARPTAGHPAERGTTADHAVGVDIGALVRRFLELPSTEDLQGAGIGVTPGWDSLAQIELVLFVEQETGVRFTSHELAEVATFAGLDRLVGEKLRIGPTG